MHYLGIERVPFTRACRWHEFLRRQASPADCPFVIRSRAGTINHRPIAVKVSAVGDPVWTVIKLCLGPPGSWSRERPEPAHHDHLTRPVLGCQKASQPPFGPLYAAAWFGWFSSHEPG